MLPLPQLLLLSLVFLLITGGCSRDDSPPASAQQNGSGTNGSTVDRIPGKSIAPNLQPPTEPTLADLLPKQGGVEGYVGSDSCRECHQDQHASWHRSFHRTMTQLPLPGAVQADFRHVVLTNDTTRFTLFETNQQYFVRMERIGLPRPGEPVPEPVESPMGLVTGSHHMQVFWVPNGQGNAQVGFPFTWLIPEKRWVPRNSTFIRPPDFVHRPEMWNVVCSRCHATGPEPRLDSVARVLNTHVGELGISCEACHGPGQRHVALRKAVPKSEKVSATVLAEEIVHPAKLATERSSQVCAFCHSMKWIGKNEPWTQHGFTFRPGADLEASTPVIRASDTNRPPALVDFLKRNPDILEDFFWPDGMIRVSGREFNGLIESPCHKGGKLTCLSCHSLHESDPDDQLARNRTDNRACIQCHDRFRDGTEITRHTHHLSTSTGSECYNCHMPHTTYGVLKAIRSHQVSSPKVTDDLSTGRPNACNLCHLDKSLSWTSGKLREWYRHSEPTLSQEQQTLPESVRLAWAGDAGQRALIAWHYSWKPAVEISGADWIPAALAPLLADEYAAVRCIAGRSMANYHGIATPEYDFVSAPAQQGIHTQEVWNRWQKQSSDMTRAPSMFALKDSAALERQFNTLKSIRDTRPVRLKE